MTGPGRPAATTVSVRYQTEVVHVGPMVEEFRATGLMILFGEQAPDELHDIAVLHRPSVADRVPEPGDVFEIDGERFQVTAVGSVVRENLLRLGHISLKADGASGAALPGDISVEARPLPQPRPGTIIRFFAAGTATSAADQSRESA